MLWAKLAFICAQADLTAAYGSETVSATLQAWAIRNQRASSLRQ